MSILSKKQENTINLASKYLDKLVDKNETFRIAILGKTGIKHAINILKEKYQPTVYFCILNLKVEKPIDKINEIRKNIEIDFNINSQHPTDLGKFEEIVARYKKIKAKELIIMIRNFNESSLKYSKEVQVFLDINQVSVILGIDKDSYDNLDHYDSSIRSRISTKKVECGFFEDLVRFKKFCDANNMEFDKYKDKIDELTFNVLEAEGVTLK